MWEPPLCGEWLRCRGAKAPPTLGIPALRCFQLGFELLLAFVQALQTQLPAMQLNAELIDVARDLGPLRFVFLQLVLEIRNPSGIFRDDFDWRGWDSNRLATFLAIDRQSGRRGVDDQCSRAVRAGENDVAARRLHRSC
jgi:hypothetical protein